MKYYFRLFVIVTMCLTCVACQAVPKTKPLTEMSTEEKQAVYMYGPVSSPKQEHPALKKALVITGVILLAIPLGILTGFAASEKQIHVGK